MKGMCFVRFKTSKIWKGEILPGDIGVWCKLYKSVLTDRVRLDRTLFTSDVTIRDVNHKFIVQVKPVIQVCLFIQTIGQFSRSISCTMCKSI